MDGEKIYVVNAGACLGSWHAYVIPQVGETLTICTEMPDGKQVFRHYQVDQITHGCKLGADAMVCTIHVHQTGEQTI
jgi:hypothetical protein